MYKFLAIVQKRKSSESLQNFEHFNNNLVRNQKWQKVFSTDTMSIYHQLSEQSLMRAHTISNNGGVILGNLFHPKPQMDQNTRSHVAPEFINYQDSNKIVESHGAHLIDNYWGSYIAFLVKNKTNSIRIIRSPMSTISCFHVSHGDVSILFSDPSMFNEIGDGILEIDWERAILTVKYAFMISEKTPIRNLHEVQIGQCLDLHPTHEQWSWLWDPIKIASNPEYSTVESASRAVRSAVLGSCATWANLYPNALLTLSGGLDSSLIAGCFAETHNSSSMACVTFYNRSTLVDERPFARATARKFGLKLYEVELSPDTINLDCYYKMRRLHWPITPLYEAERGVAEAQIAQKHGLAASLAGNGGDGLFFAYRDNIASLDYALENNINRDFFNYAMGAARLSDTTVWLTLRRMIIAKFFKKIKTTEIDFDEENKWAINKDLWESSTFKTPPSPWQLSDIKLSPGKKRQADGSIVSRHYFNVLPDSVFLEPIDPFLSQPVVEACLKIPTYILQYGGHDRKLIRDSLADKLINEVRLRRFKSDFSPYIADLVKHQLPFLKNFLLEGVLTSKNILDKNVLESALSGKEEITSVQYVKLEAYAITEAWARSWQ